MPPRSSNRSTTRPRGRGGGVTGSAPSRSAPRHHTHPNTRSKRSRPESLHTSSSSVYEPQDIQPDEDEEDEITLPGRNQIPEQDPEEVQESEEDEPGEQQKNPTDAARYEKPTLANYERLAMEWEESYIDELLAQRDRVVHNRPPPSVLAEGEARQHQYRVYRKLLSLVGHTSLATFNSHL